MHGHWAIPGGAMAAAAANDRPLVVTLHGSDVFVAERHAIAAAAARGVFRRAAVITGPSEDLCRRAERLGADSRRVRTVPYGVDARRFAPDPGARSAVRQELGLGDEPVVVSAGRLVRKKGFEFLIDAAAILARTHANVHVLIAGDGDLRGELEQRARQAMPARVSLLGNRPQHEIARLIAAADVVAVPSVRDEAGNVDGLPNFALEALASETPVVATRAGGLPQAIDDGVNGRLVPERDTAALADAIAGLLDQPAVARLFGRNARERVIRQHGWDRMAEQFEAAYDAAVASNEAMRQ
jgi:glycosyltransferase involved in cell wall biosynthesis